MSGKNVEDSNVSILSSEIEAKDSWFEKRMECSSNSHGEKLKSLSNSMKPSFSNFKLKIKMPSLSPPGKVKEMEKDAKEKGKQVQTDKSTSSPRKDKHRKPLPFWAAKWIVRSKQRISGRIDKTYHHKVDPVICRSMKEVERYELHGILPKGKWKTNYNKKGKENSSTKKPTKEMVTAEENVESQTEEEMLAIEQRKKDAENMKPFVEEFLAEARYNQLHMFDRK